MSTNQLGYDLLEAAKIAGCERTTLYRAAHKGELPLRKMGRKTIILRKDLEAWLNGLPTATFPASQRGRST